MKRSQTVLKAFLLVISMSCSAQAFLVPGPPGGGRPTPYPGNRPGGGDHLTPGYPGQPGFPGYPSEPGRPFPPRPLPPPPPPRPLPPPPPPSNPYPGNPGYGTEVKRIYIGRDVRGETLHLRHLGNIGPQYQGYEVVAVRVSSRPNYYGQPMLQLVSDGQVVATSYNVNGYDTLYPQRLLVLEQTTRTLQLAVNGDIFIDSVDVELRRGSGYYPPPPPPPPGYGQNIDINLYRTVYGNDRIDLSQYIDMYRYRGRVIEQVMVRGSARMNVGLVSLLINGFNMGQAQFSGGYSQIATYRLNQPLMIGQGADSIVLYTQGDMTIENATIVLR